MMAAKLSDRPRSPAPAGRGQPGWTAAHDVALRTGAEALGLTLTPIQAQALAAYARLLLKWNRTYNLLGTDDPDVVLESHLLDALAVVPVLRRWLPADDMPLVDVGSGGGLPGIPIAIMRPDLALILVEPVGKKAAFLRQAVAECGLARVTVREARLEALSDVELVGAPRDLTRVHAHFICRAFTSLASFAGLCAPRASADALVMAMKAARVEDELTALRSAVPHMDVLAVEPLSIPGQQVQRSLVVMHARAARPATIMSGA